MAVRLINCAVVHLPEQSLDNTPYYTLDFLKAAVLASNKQRQQSAKPVKYQDKDWQRSFTVSIAVPGAIQMRNSAVFA